MNALRFPERNRRKRLALRFAVLAAAVSVLDVAYWFTRPPELVWWRSPPLGIHGTRVRLLIPGTWDVEQPMHGGDMLKGHWITYRWFLPEDHRPAFLKRIFPMKSPLGKDAIYIYVDEYKAESQGRGQYRDRFYVGHQPSQYQGNQDDSNFARELVHVDGKMTVTLNYYRGNRSVFLRTYRQICDSLRIE